VTKIYLLGEHDGWNARKHADALMAAAWPGWDVEWALWCWEHQDWHFDDADAIVNLGSNTQELLWNTARQRAPKAVVAVRYNTCYPRYANRFAQLHQWSHVVIVESHLCYEACKMLGRIHRLSTGVDLSLFHSLVPPYQRSRKALWCAGIIGQGEERENVKRYDLALKIAEALRYHGIEMDIQAVDPNHGPIKTAREMVDWYNTGRVYVCTSIFEGVPNTGLEAAACGCAVVSTHVGQMIELVADSVNGYLVEPTVEAFVKAIVLACDGYPWMTDGIAYRVKEFNWKPLAHEYYKFFEQQIGIMRRGESFV